MKQLSLTEVKKRELAMLLEIDTFCREHQLKYFLNYGTLIGAIRHKGFIPWDDDIDLMMPREDYERFIKAFNSTTLRILSLDSDTKYYNNFIKIIDTQTVIQDKRNRKVYESGIFIDIFPYDCFDDLELVNKTYNLESFKLLSFSKLKNIIYGDRLIKDIIRVFFWAALTPVSPRYFAHKIEQLIKNYRREHGQWEALLASKLKEKEVFPSGIFDELIEGEFEGYKFPIPKNYDIILKQYYGEYMDLPPVEKQVASHELEVFLKGEI